MPPKNSLEGQHLPPGKVRLLDTCFRHLRYDFTASLIDVCYDAMQRLVKSPKGNRCLNYPYSIKTAQGHGYSLFRNVGFEELLFHERKGATVRLSYDCPISLRRQRMATSSVFESGMLCALIGYDEKASEVSTTFFEVHLRESTVSGLELYLIIAHQFQ